MCGTLAVAPVQNGTAELGRLAGVRGLRLLLLRLAAVQGRQHLVEVGVIAGVLLEVGIPEHIARSHDQRCPELERPPSGPFLAVAALETPEACRPGGR